MRRPVTVSQGAELLIVHFILHSFDYRLIQIIVFKLATECCGRPILVPVHDPFNNDVRLSVPSKRRPGTVPQGV